MVTRVRNHHKISARNYIYEEAQKRLHEVIDAAKKMNTNSIFVHATPILYFSTITNNIKCPCRNKPVVNNVLPLGSPGTVVDRVELDLTTPLFGSLTHDSTAVDTATELRDDDLFDEGSPNKKNLTVESLFGNAIDCPICFRTGNLPGYQPLGYSRLVFATHNVEDSEGYFIDSSLNVPGFRADDPINGYVEFKMVVPLIFHEVNYAVYDGKLLVPAEVTLDGFPLSQSSLYHFRGKEVKIRVMKTNFTHVVFMFRVSNVVIKADFPQDQRPKDYTIFDTMQPVQIIIDSSVPEITTGDIIYKPWYNNMWKVNDYEFFRTHDKTVIGWNITARVIQIDETVLNLMKFGTLKP